MNQSISPKYFLATLIWLVALSCREEPEYSSIRICTELFTDSALTELKSEEKTEESLLGVAPHRSLWPHGIEFPIHISVKFLNGTEFQKLKVMQYAKQWNEVSAPGWDNNKKIRLKFIPYDGTTSGNVTDIRVVFRPGGSSSYLGSDALRVHKDSPTVYFGWITETAGEDVIRQVVLHEFGHVLGLVHEHQSPQANIPWNRERVYAYYARTQHPPWDRAMVDRNIFFRYSTTETNSTAYDPLSIMHYSIPAELTDGGFSTPWNSRLSTMDSSFIKTLYRYNPCIPNETCCFDRRGRRIPCP